MNGEDVSIVLVSNRGPVSFVSRQDERGFDVARGAGGLAGALDWVARELGDHAIWISAANSDDDRAALQAGEVENLSSLLGYPVRMLDIDHDTYDRYYNEVSNRMLWFANHCLWGEAGIGTSFEAGAWADAYEPVNVRFAEEVIGAATDDALVLFQDYHLATAPGHLRELGDEHTILHFTHSAFCGPKGLEQLPDPIARGIVEGMLGADLLGFHVDPWVDGFLESCERIGAVIDASAGRVEHRGRQTWVRAYPIPIDPSDLRERADKKAARRWAKRFSSYGKRLIVRADRAEPSKNIVRGFEAFGLMLDRRADLRGKVRFVACLYPSREAMPEYRNYATEIRAAAQAVNTRHPESVELFMEDDFDRTLGAYLMYDVLLVNSIMDGMNLVSKEGPSVNEHDGAVVLSHGAGSFEELGDHVVGISDPYNVDATSAALEEALGLDADERASRAAALRKIVDASRPEDWIRTQLDDLKAISQGGGPVSRTDRRGPD